MREMRRNKQILSNEESIKILERNTAGVLALLGDKDYPYAVPLSYVYIDNKIYFHSAVEGHKVDAIRNHEKASFCVIDTDNVVPEKFTSLYKSAIAFGKVSIVPDEEKLDAIKLLSDKYSPQFREQGLKEIEETFNRFLIIKLEIEHLSGKQCIELV